MTFFSPSCCFNSLIIASFSLIISNSARATAEAGLFENLPNALKFYLFHIRLLLLSVGGTLEEEFTQIDLPLSHQVPKVFAAFPEWYIEDIADFLLFTIQNVPQIVDDEDYPELTLFLIVFICSPNYIQNPYLVAKLVEALFLLSPSLHSLTEHFHQRILSHPLAQKHLAKALMKFYADVESTGASSEFYDKFTIRYHISVIMRALWGNPIHQNAICEESKTGQYFVRFINMLMNDTTFLLDESLETLKRIHELQTAMDNKETWASQTQEQQTTRLRQLQSDERQCKSYLTLANETVDMFFYLTKLTKEPFLRPELVDRLAAMLNFNLQQLCGPKCNNLKVKNPTSYGWHPKKLLLRLAHIYLNLDSEPFALAVAADERSYKKELFDKAIER